MRFHLLTVEDAEQQGEAWCIAPMVPLKSLIECGPTMAMPMAGDQLELRTPDGRVRTASVASFGVDAWMDEGGNLRITTDLSAPSLTLFIAADPALTAIPPGTEIWLSNAQFVSDAKDAGSGSPT